MDDLFQKFGEEDSLWCKFVSSTTLQRPWNYGRETNMHLKLAQAVWPFGKPLWDSLNFPREVRDVVYDSLLSFKGNISEKRLAPTLDSNPGKDYTGSVWSIGHYSGDPWKGRRSIVWIHPLFHISRKVRQEAAEQYFGCNNFASRTLLTLWTPELPPDFRNLIATLSITWPSLGPISIQACKALQSFKGLCFLNIYLNFEQLKSQGGNSLGGWVALEFVASNLVSSVNTLEQVNVFEVELNSSEKIGGH